MARLRNLYPQMWEDTRFVDLELGAKLLYVVIFSNADDEGKYEVSAPRWMMSGLGINVSGAQVENWYEDLAQCGLVVSYGDRFGFVPGYTNQPIRKPTLSKLPPIPKTVLSKHPKYMAWRARLFPEVYGEV